MAENLCVIFNPAAGKRRARGRLEGLRRAWGKHIQLLPTERPGHAEELAEQAAHAGFDIVAAAGGDGTVHEVANGILRAARPDVRFAVIPIGSANDYAASLDWEFSRPPTEPTSDVRRSFDDTVTDEVATRALDVGRVRDAGDRERYFVCCLGLGLNGAVTLESRRIHRLQGLALYGLATVRALWYHYACPQMELEFDEQPRSSVPTLMLSVLVGRREGGFVLAPNARLDDGWFDFVHAGALSRWEVLNLLPRLAISGPPSYHPKVGQGRCRHLHLRSEAPLTVHIDGEFFCKPEDGVRELDVQMMPRCLMVKRIHEGHEGIRRSV
jgi:diacylglycerol kinase family enzyme